MAPNNHEVAPDPRSRSLGYFPAVDGLRALAVAVVMLFHLDPDYLPGGFVGVDIFFVISGFVVTASLAHIDFPSFKNLLAHFYARRLVRILPALGVCLLLTILVFVMLIPRSWLSDLTERTGVGAFLGLSNIVLALNRDTYFAPTSEFNPFLHTWSLGVEEQFYFVFPFLLYMHGKARGNARAEARSLGLIAALGVASFIASGVLTAIDAKYAFYLLPSRFWELAAGMVLALSFSRWQPRIAAMSERGADALLALALALLAVSFATLTETQFPFPTGLLPVTSAAILIVFACARPQMALNRVFASAPVLWVGLRSYSLYLWHWPVYVMMRWTVGFDTLPLQLAGVALSVVLGHASYTLVELPLRHSGGLKALPRGKVVMGGAAAAIAGVLVSPGLFLLQPHVSLSATVARDDWYTTNNTRLLAGPPGCVLVRGAQPVADGQVSVWRRAGCPEAPAAQGRLFVIGDSHAASYQPMLRQFAMDTGDETRLYFRTQCAFLPLNVPMESLSHCRRYTAEVQKRFLAELRPGDILFLPSLRMDQGTDQWGELTDGFFDPGKASRSMREARALIDELTRKTGALVVFEAPKPIVPSPVYRCIDWYMALNPVCRHGLSISRADVEQRREPVVLMMRVLASANPSVRMWDPLPVLCPGRECQSLDGDAPIFLDRHHVSAHANLMLRNTFTDDFGAWFAEARRQAAPAAPTPSRPAMPAVPRLNLAAPAPASPAGSSTAVQEPGDGVQTASAGGAAETASAAAPPSPPPVVPAPGVPEPAMPNPDLAPAQPAV